MSEDAAKDELDGLAVEAIQRANLIAASLPEGFEIAMLSLNSKLPFKALSLREVLIHRVADLGLSATDCLQAKRVVSSATLTRAAMETLARVMELHYRLSRFLSEPNVADMNKYLDRALLGSRNDEAMPRAIHIVEAVKAVDVEIPSFSDNYKSLCEYAHPNWSGGLGTFGQIDHENFRIVLGNPERAARALRTIALMLNATLAAFEVWYNRLAEVIGAFNEHFEANEQGAK